MVDHLEVEPPGKVVHEHLEWPWPAIYRGAAAGGGIERAKGAGEGEGEELEAVGLGVGEGEEYGDGDQYEDEGDRDLSFRRRHGDRLRDLDRRLGVNEWWS